MSIVYSLKIYVQTVFDYSIVFTAFSFFSVGFFKGKVIGKFPLRSGMSTLAIGGMATAVSFFVGNLLSEYIK
jgi:VIT1/CCC1 family predicted Fe2+/Mn2+ transporter